VIFLGQKSSNRAQIQIQGPNYWSFGLVDAAQFVPRCPQSPPCADDGYSLHCPAPANDLVAHDNAILLSKDKKTSIIIIIRRQQLVLHRKANQLAAAAVKLHTVLSKNANESHHR